MIRYLSLSLLLCFAVPAPAHETEPQIDVPEAAKAAAMTADRFFSALSTGNLEEAGALLDPQVIILESGGAEHSAAEYLGGHAKSDAEFLKGARHTLLRRTGRAAGDFAWVASESELHVEKDGKPATYVSTETMLLRSGKDGWTIVHVHWSSRAKKPGESH
jgi:ketosteroid isomerase-like protein